MDLPVNPPVLPMLAKRIDALPEGAGYLYEPKWDGFRVLVFRDGDEVLLQSRDEKPLNRYFPELFAPLKAQLPEKCALDGELVVPIGQELDFEALQQRIHPAESRVTMLARETPASIVFWDLLCIGDEDLRGVAFAERRKRLEKALAKVKPPLHVTPLTEDRATAQGWFERFEGAGLDGVMAKPSSGAYESNKRTMLKVKHARECDCVVGGFRWHKDMTDVAIGSLLLGLYDDEGTLHHVGVCSSFPMEKRKQLVEFLQPYRENALEGHPWSAWAGHHHQQDGHRMPGAKSRWTGSKDLSWIPLRAELVVEVAYDHMQGDRFRHNAQLRRFRTDKPPRECTYAQLEVVAPHELKDVFGTAS